MSNTVEMKKKWFSGGLWGGGVSLDMQTFFFLFNFNIKNTKMLSCQDYNFFSGDEEQLTCNLMHLYLHRCLISDAFSWSDSLIKYCGNLLISCVTVKGEMAGCGQAINVKSVVADWLRASKSSSDAKSPECGFESRS